MTRARAPRPHEVDAARFDPRLIRAFAERRADDSWRTRGVCCRQDPDTFFPPPREAADAALALCRGCAVLGSCLAWALDAGDRYGVWGGTTPRERRAMTVVWREAYEPVEIPTAEDSGRVLADYQLVTDLDTPRGVAQFDIAKPTTAPSSLLVMGHGAGGGVDAPDLVAVRDAVLARGVAVARVTQPYRVAGKRAPPAAPALDEAWIAAVNGLRKGTLKRLPLIVGGRSSGARVACRTARVVGADAILALAFPLHPPGRPERSRADELETGLPTLVVNGDKDPFGVPDASKTVEICVRPGAKHDLRIGLNETSTLVVEWLCRMGLAT